VTGQFGVVSSGGSAWDLAFSSDPQQRFVFVADGHDKKVIILQRDAGSRGCNRWGRERFQRGRMRGGDAPGRRRGNPGVE